MRAEQRVFSIDTEMNREILFNFDPDLILIFATIENINDPSVISDIRKIYPEAIITGCSGGGNIAYRDITDSKIVINALQFDEACLDFHKISLNDYDNSFDAGKELVNHFNKQELKHILVFADGIHVHGDDLMIGMKAHVDAEVSISGGLATDDQFDNTLVIDNDGIGKSKLICAVAFYGNGLLFGYGSGTGWTPFGIEREVTKSDLNVLYELDGKPALDLYREYLGDFGKDLPGSALLIPLLLDSVKEVHPAIRSIININEEEKSLIFSGNIPVGSKIKMMKANAESLLRGADDAATESLQYFGNRIPEFCLIISSVGRRLVLKQLAEDEVDFVREMVGKTTISGFYGMGQFGPGEIEGTCRLHNQTVSITAISEI